MHYANNIFRCLRCSQFEYILNNSSLPDDGEKLLGALTAGERTPWAEAREKYFRAGVNLASLQAIGTMALIYIVIKSIHAFNI